MSLSIVNKEFCKNTIYDKSLVKIAQDQSDYCLFNNNLGYIYILSDEFRYNAWFLIAILL